MTTPAAAASRASSTCNRYRSANATIGDAPIDTSVTKSSTSVPRN
jgi:hypothetical protein